ncbi:myelin protein zero-like protein 3 [Myotis lucifugus]|uniref:myelin protein zero-like protein 3 n=1 Tax=Myotis lucifugus TaxID=59463 RepID=UPI000CCC9DF7|nr:myelin protein zero-like protein 3 [Myotis lucifugus]
MSAGPPLPAPPAGFGTMLSSVALLSILVFVPSAVVVALLLVRMVRKSAGLRKRSKSGYKKSSIEVSDETQTMRTRTEGSLQNVRRITESLRSIAPGTEALGGVEPAGRSGRRALEPISKDFRNQLPIGDSCCMYELLRHLQKRLLTTP